ncbi:MAG: hypothetical protein LBR26_11485 [Prevotella sp.]|jgi:hypothetical protein|nr:hypothetical protein [Prevotella sp.]
MLGKVRIITVVLLLPGLYCPEVLVAQSEKTGWESYEYVHESNTWLHSDNAAGLYSFTINSLSYAEIYFNKKDGRLINYFQSDDNLEYGGEVKSLYRLNPKTVFYGNVKYSRFEGKNMGGSAFIDPYKNPFDIVEYADSTCGKKALDTYHLTGAFSIELSRGLNVGAKLDYKASNYAKFRDLRHENKELDMTFSLGTVYRRSSFWEAGVNYIYRRRLEEIRFQSYGNKDRQFNSLISFGAFYGHQERFNRGDSYTDPDVQKPLFEEYQGASLQLNLTPGPQILFFNELSLKRRDGFFGKRGTSSIVYTEHDSNITEYRGNLSLLNKKDRHTFSFNASRESLYNYENSYQPSTSPNGTSVINYSGQVQVLRKTVRKLGGKYTAYLGIQDHLPVWVLSANAESNNMKQTVSLYPDYRKQDINQWKAGISAGRNIIRSLNQYSLALELCYISGGGNEKMDGTHDSSQGQVNSASLDRYIYREFEYLTTERIRGNIGFRYSRLFRDRMKGYAQLNYALTKAFSTEYIGKTFNELSLSVGVGF